jgi:hypothetical protein
VTRHGCTAAVGSFLEVLKISLDLESFILHSDVISVLFWFLKKVKISLFLVQNFRFVKDISCSLIRKKYLICHYMHLT